jgi:hypothetical protein
MDVWPAMDYGPLSENIRCLVSIGTGVPSMKPFGKNMIAVAKTLIDISTQTENTAKLFMEEYGDLDEQSKYFRFNVTDGLEKVGLEEDKKMHDIAAATRRYVQTQEISKKMKASGGSLAGRECTHNTVQTKQAIVQRLHH